MMRTLPPGCQFDNDGSRSFNCPMLKSLSHSSLNSSLKYLSSSRSRTLLQYAETCCTTRTGSESKESRFPIPDGLDLHPLFRIPPYFFFKRVALILPYNKSLLSCYKYSSVFPIVLKHKTDLHLSISTMHMTS